MSKFFVIGMACLSWGLLAAVPPAGADWIGDGTPIEIGYSQRTYLVAVEDGAGGVIAVWDEWGPTNYGIFAQRLDASGNTVWGEDAKEVAHPGIMTFYLVGVADGAGGVIVTWEQPKKGGVIGDNDIYAQRVDAAGNAQWGTLGACVCTEVSGQHNPVLVSDGAGGAIIAWEDYRTVNAADIFAQRLNSSGVPATANWTADGVPVCTIASYQYSPSITSDGAGGAIIAWQDNRNGPSSDIYAQRVTAAGTRWWTSGGTSVCVSPNAQAQIVMTPDGAHGAILAWRDQRLDTVYGDIYVNRIDENGYRPWSYNGLAMCTAAHLQEDPVIASDGAGGAYVTWVDHRVTDELDVYARRINSAGTVMWQPDGVAVCSAPGWQRVPRISPDGFGNAFITWTDRRFNEAAGDLYAQRLDSAGANMWVSNGISVCSVPGGRSAVNPPISLGDGGMISVWADGRASEPYFEVYAQKVDGMGRIGVLYPQILSVSDVPADQGGFVRITIEPSVLDGNPSFPATLYNVWQRIDSAKAAGSLIMGNGSDLFAMASLGPVPAGPVPFWTWEIIGSFAACQQEQYVFRATTLADSSGSRIPYAVYAVSVHTADPFVWASSDPDSGYSVDNIAPGVPEAIVASYQAGSVALDWRDAPETDFQYYRIYRDTDPGFVPRPANLVQEVAASSWTDPTTNPWGYYYKITVLDHAGNESEAGSPESVSGVNGGAVPARTALLGAVPNPFNPSTKLSFEMATSDHARLKVYDTAGRLVVTLVNEHRDAGLNEVIWDGRDQAGRIASAGVYLYRLEVEDYVETMRMTLIK